MSAAHPNVVPLTQCRSLSVAVAIGLVIAIVACFLCALFALLYARSQMSGRELSQKPRSFLPRRKDDYYHAPTMSTSSFGCAEVSRTAAVATLVHNEWHTQPSKTDSRAAHGMQDDCQSTEVLASAPGNPELEGYEPSDSLVVLLTDCRGLVLSESTSARRLGLDLERAQLQLLPPAHTKRGSSQEQLLWRNSSGGSSCYSRPSSWYSVPTTEEPGKIDLGCGFRGGPGPTIRTHHATAYRYKALPPTPVRKEQIRAENVAVEDSI